MTAMDHTGRPDRKTRMKLKRCCSELVALIDQLRKVIKSRSLEQSDRYALYTLIEKYTRRLEEAERERKSIEAKVRAQNPKLAKERQENRKIGASGNSVKKKRKVKLKKKSKVRYPKTPIQVEHAAKKKKLHKASGSDGIRAKFVSGGATGLKK